MRFILFALFILFASYARQTGAALPDSPSDSASSPASGACARDSALRVAVRARHIAVIAFVKDTSAGHKAATPEELAAAYDRLVHARAELEAGNTFEAVWAKYSDPRTAPNTTDGDLGFFERGGMVPEVEKQAFCLPVGALSPIIRTVFGYHIVQVTEVRLRQ